MQTALPPDSGGVPWLQPSFRPLLPHPGMLLLVIGSSYAAAVLRSSMRSGPSAISPMPECSRHSELNQICTVPATVKAGTNHIWLSQTLIIQQMWLFCYKQLFSVVFGSWLFLVVSLFSPTRHFTHGLKQLFLYIDALWPWFIDAKAHMHHPSSSHVCSPSGLQSRSATFWSKVYPFASPQVHSLHFTPTLFYWSVLRASDLVLNVQEITSGGLLCLYYFNYAFDVSIQLTFMVWLNTANCNISLQISADPTADQP